MQTVKTQLIRINDELLEFYNRPGMALHFQPSNLKQLKEIIEKLIFLEDVLDKYPVALKEFKKKSKEKK